LYSFTGGSDGSSPAGSLAISPEGVLYGTTGSTGSNDVGTAFSLTPPVTSGAPWALTLLHSFRKLSGYGGDGLLLNSSSGVLDGTTEYGGPTDCGTIFRLTSPTVPGGSWTYTVLYSFAASECGFPETGPNGLVLGAGGVLYGTTYNLGTDSDGSVFALTL
jgi:uncharacterized repeat protein (TIGR03803 family)